MRITEFSTCSNVCVASTLTLSMLWPGAELTAFIVICLDISAWFFSMCEHAVL